MDSVEIGLDQLMLRSLLIGSILAIFIKNMQRLLTNTHLEIVPVIISHKIFQPLFCEDFGELA
jgi:hypothetical protein